MISNQRTTSHKTALAALRARLSAFVSCFSASFPEKAGERERSTNILFALYRIASEAYSRDEAVEALQKELESVLDAKVVFFFPEMTTSKHVDLVIPTDAAFAEADRRAAHHCWEEMETSGLGSPSHSATSWHFEPMVSAAGKAGVLGIQPKDKKNLDAWRAQLVADIAVQTATLLQHIMLKTSMQEKRLFQERENLRALLLSSVSHDFKTPLAGIIGALSVYRSLGTKLSEQKRDALVETAIDEAQRLDNFITNILDMARLESGSVKLRREWYDMESTIENVVRRMKPRCRNHVVKVYPCPIGVEVYMDILMTEQIFQNILDNACKYTQTGTGIEITCRIDEDKGFICEIRDYGPGIPPENMDAIFNKFTRLQKKDTQVAGTGLGLAIAKAIMEAQDGWITAGNHPEGGAIFTICLPQWRMAKDNRTINIEE
jgi:two-component system sensor histidine kinase KdpD